MIGANEQYWKFVFAYSKNNNITWFGSNLLNQVPYKYLSICRNLTNHENRPYDWDGQNCYLENNSEELILHEICHHIVAKLKPNDKRFKINRTKLPEFGLGNAPSTPNKNLANSFRSMSIARSILEEYEVCLLAIIIAYHLGRNAADHAEFTNFFRKERNQMVLHPINWPFKKSKGKNIIKRLIKLQILDNNLNFGPELTKYVD